MQTLADFDRFGAPMIVGAVLLLFVLESVWPLRARVESRIRRVSRNLVFAALSGLVARGLVLSTVYEAARFAELQHWGVLGLAGLPALPSALLGFVLLDASMYAWHRMNHRVPWLWRFHVVHHVDLDLDVSTALRFHPGELLLSVPFRAAQVLLIGPAPALALGYEIGLQIATAFHHANWALPRRLDRILRLVVVTPRMHQIHHSVVTQETESNWSVIFSVWDRLARTYRRDTATEPLVIGVPAYRALEEVSLGKMLRAPWVQAP